ncbi:hypothetical protein F5888DRAFT_1602271 [Russula emetica]|nr:hypothetical protein F5888DRAFT_1602271 [Russula emetica]
MSPFYRILLVAAYAASVTLIAFPHVLLSSALAKPVARPLSSRTVAVHHAKERSVRVLKSKISKRKAVVPHNLYPSRANVSHHPHSHSSTGPHVPATAYGRSGDVNIDVVTQNINILNNYYSTACNNAHTLKAYSSQPSASSQKSKSNFEQKCASALTDFHTNSRGFAKTLHNLGADKGREHYDEYDPIERLIKDDIDLHKDVLGYVNELCRRYPSVCLYLGPIIYDIKCILDEMLDIVENLTDKIIGDCKPFLEGLVGEYNVAVCKSGFDVVGECLGSNTVLHSTH